MTTQTLFPLAIASGAAFGTFAASGGGVSCLPTGVLSREEFGTARVALVNMDRLLARVRQELGDFGSPFRDTFLGTGELSEYDLSVTNVASVQVSILAGGIWTDLLPSQYGVDTRDGVVYLGDDYAPLADGATLIVTGSSQGMFNDTELITYINEAVAQHTSGARTRTRYRDDNGLIKFREDAVTLSNLPEVEIYLVALLATIEALWTAATDTSTDVDISTPEGTSIPRSQRFRQSMAMIDALTTRYKELCAQLNVGLYRVEMGTLRRVSRTTNRYVPIFVDREYDDTSLPQRLLPPIDHRNDDTSGIPSPAGWW